MQRRSERALAFRVISGKRVAPVAVPSYDRVGLAGGRSIPTARDQRWTCMSLPVEGRLEVGSLMACQAPRSRPGQEGILIAAE